MTEASEYWNIPKSSEEFLTAQSTNLTVFLDHADNSLAWGLGASDVAAIAGASIASLALLVTLWQGCVARKHNRLSVKPAINVYRNIVRVTEGRDGEPCLRLICQLKSCGLGPVQNLNIRLSVGGQLILCSKKGIGVNARRVVLVKFREALNDSIIFGAVNNFEPDINVFKEAMLPSGESIDVLEFDFREDERELNAPDRLINLINIDFEYEDFYGNKFKNNVLTR